MDNKTLLKLEKVTKTYQLAGVSQSVLKEVDLEIKPGDFLSIVGPSGSGKSTLLQLLGLLDRATSGQFTFLDQEIRLQADDQLATLRNRYIGFIFQQFNLLARTSALENVLLPTFYAGEELEKSRPRAEALLAKLGLGKRLDYYPNQLSGGQQQRVAIARALINDPKVIFADEPTGNLDSVSGREVFEILKELNQEGKTVVIVTHDQGLAQKTAGRIYLKDGEVTKQ